MVTTTMSLVHLKAMQMSCIICWREVLPVNRLIAAILGAKLNSEFQKQKVINNIDRISLPVEKLAYSSTRNFQSVSLSSNSIFEKGVPISTEKKNAAFNSMPEVLAVVIKTLEDTKTSLPSATGFLVLSG
jgi:hypothetical protein